MKDNPLMPTDNSAREPDQNCALCPRLQAFRDAYRTQEPSWFNAPVPGFGDQTARLLIVGLAPGLRGANRTGRPFTGDWAGDLLYPTLIKTGFAHGNYDARPDDGLVLKDALITNAVRCVPPENKPVGAEINACRPFLVDQIHALTKLKVIIALGGIAHNSTLKALGHRVAAYKFAHKAVHNVGDELILIDSYHCSRYNTNTGRLTTEMFEQVFELAQERLNEERRNNGS